MPRPITKDDIKRWRETGWSFRTYTDERIGIFIKLTSNAYYNQNTGLCAYSTNITDGWPCWCSKKTLEKRKKIGHPKPRRKPGMMRDISMFSFDEIEAAMKVIEELG